MQRTYFQDRVEACHHLVLSILFAWQKFVAFENCCFIKHGKYTHSQNTSETITACILEANYAHSENDIGVKNKYKEKFAGHIPDSLTKVLHHNCGSFTHSDAQMQSYSAVV